MTSTHLPDALLSEAIPSTSTPPRNTTLSREFSQLPVTALSFASSTSRNLLLAAQDTGVAIYDASTAEVVAHVPVFAEQIVHGISVHGERVWVWGSKYVAVFTIEGLENGREFSPEVLRVDAPDWVYDGKISPYDPSRAVLATAHNEVVSLSIDEEAKRVVVGEVISPARPILYSAELTWLDASSVLIAAGTAFGEILVWKCHVSSAQSSHEMLFVFTGHEGSIYGVTISPPLTLPGSSEQVRLMASCSDDRTVRVWDITERDEERRKYDFISARETGFSEILPNADQPKLEGGEPVAVAMGHLSRIWGVEMSGADARGVVDVWTFGEDSTAWRWKLSLEKSESKITGDLTFEKTLSYHDGKHLWSHARTKFGDKGFLATGGADGRISLIETGLEGAPLSDMVTLDCQQLCPETVVKAVSKKKAKPEVFGRFDFVSADQMLVNTSTGRLLLGTYTDEGLQWQPITLAEGLQDEIKQCYVLQGVAEGKAMLGTTTGNVYFYKDKKLSFLESFHRKIVDISVLTLSEDTADLLIHIFGTACPTYVRLNTQTGQVLDQKATTGIDERFNCTSAGLLGPYLLLGSRHGWLSLLHHENDSYVQTLTLVTPTRDAITSIIPLPTSSDSPPTLFLCTSRDSCYRIYSFTQEPIPQITLVHHSSLPFGPMIESAFFTAHSPPQLIFTGFRSRNFIVWNETLREERLSVECGGAHRSFTFHHSPTDEGVMRFAFNRASKLSVHSQLRLDAAPVKRGTHGREIRAVSEGGGYIATGGEDTSIRICEKHPENRCLASLKAHVSGLQKLKWLDQTTLSEGHLLFSSAGNEEFFVWRIKPLKGTTYPSLGVIQESVFDDKSPVGDLRIMDFDLEHTSDNGSVIVTMAFSSSVLARYMYHPTTGFQILARGSYTGACLTQMRHLGQPAVSEDAAVLTASTDGHAAVWRCDLQEKTFTVQQVLRVHQSSVKCLDVVPLSAEDAYIITGGDDNALGITLLAPNLRLLPHGAARNAHAASINGLITRLNRTQQTIDITTISNDQRLKTWTFHTTEGKRLRLARDVYSGVADPGDISELAGGRLIIVGVGVEVWSTQG